MIKMKRSVKNAIVGVLIAVMCTSMFFTMSFAAKNSSQGGQMGQPPSVQSGQEQGGDSSSQQDNSQGNSPSEPSDTGDSSSSDGKSQSSDSNAQAQTQGQSQGQPPEKPSGDQNSSSGQSNGDSSNQGVTSSDSNSQNEDQDTQSGQNEQSNGGQDSQQGGQPGDMQQGQGGAGGATSIGAGYKVAFGIEALITSLLVMYLIMSRGNKKGFKETFINRDKIVIMVLATVVMTSGLTCTETLLAQNCFAGGQQTTQVQQASYSASTEITEDATLTGKTFTSSNADENALLVNGDGIEVNVSDSTVKKTGDSDGGDSTSFYGTNSAVTAKSGANLTLKNLTVTTDATGANGVFCYGGSATTNNSSGDGTTVTISDSTITTTKDNSGGIMTTGGGVMKAKNLTVNTAGTSSAAIRTDRGGGDVTVEKGTYTTTGKGSPAVYSTADITVKSAKLIAKASEGVVIEGKNSVTLEDVDLVDTNNELNGQSTTYKNIFLYQSMSGDADEGTSEFKATDCNITTNKGDTFYVTNTTAKIILENNKITNNDSDGNFLRVQKDSWGNEGSNGGDVTLEMKDQKAIGDIIVDSISTLVMELTDGSYYEGTINGDNDAESITLTLDKSSKIKLTGDSYVTKLDNADSSNSNIDFNGYTLYVNGKAVN